MLAFLEGLDIGGSLVGKVESGLEKGGEDLLHAKGKDDAKEGEGVEEGEDDPADIGEVGLEGGGGLRVDEAYEDDRDDEGNADGSS